MILLLSKGRVQGTKGSWGYTSCESSYRLTISSTASSNGSTLTSEPTASCIQICGVSLPEGMRENEKFPHPIITPTTKAEMGLHDEDISKEEILAKGLATPEEYEILEKYTLALFERGTEIAAERGLILVDTKYEFGKHNGEIYLMDEIHTPDSSRYFYSEGYQERFENGEPQRQLSKEFVREWLMENGFQGKEGQKVPEMTPEIVKSISDRYIELYEHLTGETFVKGDTDSLNGRIEKNVTDYLK